MYNLQKEIFSKCNNVGKYLFYLNKLINMSITQNIALSIALFYAFLESGITKRKAECNLRLY